MFRFLYKCNKESIRYVNDVLRVIETLSDRKRFSHSSDLLRELLAEGRILHFLRGRGGKGMFTRGMLMNINNLMKTNNTFNNHKSSSVQSHINNTFKDSTWKRWKDCLGLKDAYFLFFLH